MMRRAEESGRMFAYFGLLELVAFCDIHNRRLMLLLPDGVIDIVSAFAATLLDEAWNLVPFARLVVPVVHRGGALVHGDLRRGDTLHGRGAG